MFTIGGYDLDTYAPNSTVTWNPLVGNDNNSLNGYWTVALSGAMTGNTTVPLTASYGIVDTGTSYLAMPTAELMSIVQTVADKGL